MTNEKLDSAVSKNIIGHVWYSQKIHFNTAAYTTLENHGQLKRVKNEKLSAAMKRVDQQELVKQGELHEDLYINNTRGGHKKRQYHIMAADGLMISDPCADVLRQFDLGEHGIYPVRLWKNDRKTPSDKVYSYLTHGNRKDTFLPEHSPEASRLHESKALWFPPPNPVHDQLFYSKEALEGVDMWCERKTARGIMLSDRLATALKKAKMARDWMMLRCPVIEV